MMGALLFCETAMRRLFFLLLLAFALPAVGEGLLDSRPTSVLGASSLNNSSDFLPVREAFRLELRESTADHLTLRFIPADGYYLYRHRFQFRTEPADIALGAAQLPPGEKKHDDYFGDVEVYHGIIDVTLPRPASAQHPFTLLVTYQGCADKGLCYPPETQRLSIDGKGTASTAPVMASNAADAPAPAGWSWHELLLYLLAGIGLTFTPCVLPMLPIVSSIVLRDQVSGLRGLALSLAYALPMAVCFAVLGALMGLFGAQFNLQARLQSAWVLVPFALIFAVFAVAMFGAFELKLPRALSNRLERIADNTQGGSLWGAAVLGVVSSLLVSPCVSVPLAGALVYISASGDVLGGALKLFALGVGMGVPLVVVATGGAAWLPKSGAWMLSVKNAIGVLLLAVSVGLLSRVLPGPITLVLVGLLAAGVGLFLGALEFGFKSPRQRIAQLGGLLLLSYAMACWFGAFSGQSDPFKPLGNAGASLASGGAAQPAGSSWQTITSGAELDSALAAAKAAGRPLVLDWYADWCISCKVIEHEVLTDPGVIAGLAPYQRVRFDMTESNAEQRAILDRYKLFGPPALLFFDAQGQESTTSRIVGEIDVKSFLGKLPR
jgi:thiol:disulfide interchange protein DsbD